jgi:hypothetical protein
MLIIHDYDDKKNYIYFTIDEQYDNDAGADS